MVQQQGPIVVTEAGNEKTDTLKMSVFILCSMRKFQHNDFFFFLRFKPGGISGQQKADFHPDHQ